MKKVTSIYLEEDIIRRLKIMEVNVSDLANTLLELWLKFIKEEGPVLKQVIERAVVLHEIQTYLAREVKAL